MIRLLKWITDNNLDSFTLNPENLELITSLQNIYIYLIKTFLNWIIIELPLLVYNKFELSLPVCDILPLNLWLFSWYL